jgi:hypothetical protein
MIIIIFIELTFSLCMSLRQEIEVSGQLQAPAALPPEKERNIR